jgi:hypothetical protein
MLKVWWQDAALFVYFSYFITHNHSIKFIQNTFFRRHLPGPLSIAFKLSGKTLPVVPSRESELWPAFRQADALPTEPCRTVDRNTGVSYDNTVEFM